MSDERSIEQRGLDDARQGLNNPPHDPEGRQAYEAGRNVHLAEERRRAYSDQVAEGASSLGVSVSNGSIRGPRTDAAGRIVWTSNIYEGFLAFAFVGIVALFTMSVYVISTLPFALFRSQPPGLFPIISALVFIAAFCAPVYSQKAREILRLGVAPFVAIGLVVHGLSTVNFLNALAGGAIAGAITFGLCWLIYGWMERVKPL